MTVLNRFACTSSRCARPTCVSLPVRARPNLVTFLIRLTRAHVEPLRAPDLRLIAGAQQQITCCSLVFSLERCVCERGLLQVLCAECAICVMGLCHLRTVWTGDRHRQARMREHCHAGSQCKPTHIEPTAQPSLARRHAAPGRAAGRARAHGGVPAGAARGRERAARPRRLRRPLGVQPARSAALVPAGGGRRPAGSCARVSSWALPAILAYACVGQTCAGCRGFPSGETVAGKLAVSPAAASA